MKIASFLLYFNFNFLILINDLINDFFFLGNKPD